MIVGHGAGGAYTRPEHREVYADDCGAESDALQPETVALGRRSLNVLTCSVVRRSPLAWPLRMPGLGTRHRLARGGLVGVRAFLGLALTEAAPDHSTISRTRRLIDLDTHRTVFTWVLQCLGIAGLIKGKTLAIDATTLEANAALRSIVRPPAWLRAGRDTGDLSADRQGRITTS